MSDRLRVLLISTVFPPQNAPAAPRLAGFAAAWAAAGHQVTVLTTPKRNDHRGYATTGGGYEVVDVPFRTPRLLNALRSHDKSGPADNTNLTTSEPRARPGWVRWLRSLRERTGVFGAARMPDLTDFWIGPAVNWARAQRPDSGGHAWDIVVSSSGPYTTHLAARRIRREGLARAWAADFRDLWTDNDPFTGLFPFTLIERRLERSCLREADMLTTISPALARRLEQRAGRPAEVIYNGYDQAQQGTLSNAPALPRDGRRRLLFTGTLYPGGHEPEPLMAALAMIRQRRPELVDRFRLVVVGPKADQWQQLARAAGVGSMIDCAGEVDRTTALRMQRDADALLLLDWRDPEAGVVTSKLFEYLLARGPILVVGGQASSTIGQIVARTGRGIHLGRDADAIAATIEQLIDDPGLIHLHRDQQAIAEFDIRRQADRYLELLQRIAAPAR